LTERACQFTELLKNRGEDPELLIERFGAAEVATLTRNPITSHKEFVVSDETSSPITPPESYPKADAARAVSKGIVGAVPVVGSALAEAIEHLAPDPAAKDRARWEDQVTSRLNKLTAISRRLQIAHNSFAWELALFANNQDTNANGEVAISDADIFARFPDISGADLEDALSDLLSANWINCWQDANSCTGFGGFYTKALLFVHTDPFVRHTSPIDDARRVASFILDQRGEDAVSAKMIEENMGWEPRRLYPVLAFLVEEVIPAGAFDSPYHPQYPFIWLDLNGSSRRALRQFIEV
jgi:hypothetical protein